MNPSICPACGAAGLSPMQEERIFSPPTGEVAVTLKSSRCENCNAKVTTRQQRAENLKALAERRSAYGEWLTGEEVLALRKRYGITQTQASEVFGKGKVAFSRYENEAYYPDLTMTRLMRLALNDPRVMKQLAGIAGIELPLVDKRINEALLKAWLNAPLRQMETAQGATRIVSTLGGAASRLFAEIASKVQATQSAATTAQAASDTLIAAANDERFALAA